MSYQSINPFDGKTRVMNGEVILVKRNTASAA